MVQIVNMQPRQTVWNALGQGLGNAMQMKANEKFQERAEDRQEAREMRKMDLSSRLSDMYEQKKSSRKIQEEGSKGLAILKMLKPDATEQEQAAAYAMGGEMTYKLLENYGSDAFSKFVASGGDTSKVDDTFSRQRPQQQQSQQQDVLGRQPTENVNIQGMPSRQPNIEQRNMQPDILQPNKFVQEQDPRQPFMQMGQQAPQQALQQPGEMQLPDATKKMAADMSDDEFNRWLSSKPFGLKAQEKIAQERRKMQEFNLKQKEDVRRGRAEEREEYKFQQELKKQPEEVRKFVGDTTKDYEDSNAIIRILDEMKELREKGALGFTLTGNLSPENRKIRDKYNGLASQLVKIYKQVSGRAGIPQNEFLKIVEEWLPQARYTDATNEGREDHFRFEAQGSIEKFDKMQDIIKKEGKIPEDINQRVAIEMDPRNKNKLSDEQKAALPPVSQFKTGDIIRNKSTGKRMMNNGTSWVEVQQ